MKNMMRQPLLGYCPEIKNFIRISGEAKSSHMLFTGKTKGGKTYAALQVGFNLAKEGALVGGLNFASSYDFLLGNSAVCCIDIAKNGLPFSLVTPVRKMNGEIEAEGDTIERAVEVFCSVRPLAIRQKVELRKGLTNVMRHKGAGCDEFLLLRQTLEAEDNDEAYAVLERYRPLLTRIKTQKRSAPLFEPGKLTIFDLSGFPRPTQLDMAEMLLSIIWGFFQIWGQYVEKPLYLLLDEFQNLNYHKGSTIEQILREGRKFNLSLLLATQTLKTFSTSERAILGQAGTRLCFSPDLGDKQDILRQIPEEERKRVREILESLRSGECLAIGDFECNGVCFSKNVRMTFRHDAW